MVCRLWYAERESGSAMVSFGIISCPYEGIVYMSRLVDAIRHGLARACFCVRSAHGWEIGKSKSYVFIEIDKKNIISKFATDNTFLIFVLSLRQELYAQ